MSHIRKLEWVFTHTALNNAIDACQSRWASGAVPAAAGEPGKQGRQGDREHQRDERCKGSGCVTKDGAARFIQALMHGSAELNFAETWHMLF